MSNTKFCKGCNLTKPFKDFSKSKRSKYGLDIFCRDCKAKNAVEYRKKNYLKVRSYENNYEKIRAVKQKQGLMPHRVIAKRLRSLNRRIIKQIIENPDNMYEETFTRNFGCSKTVFINRFEREFEKNPGMGWHNYGAWHMDHIKPLGSFTLDTEANQKLANHYSNLRPIWATANMKKAYNYEVEQTI